jgi:hypothetical protein
VASLYPSFGAQIFEVNPYRVRFTRRHRRDVSTRQANSEALNHKVSRFELREPDRPMPDFYSIDMLRCQRGIHARA